MADSKKAHFSKSPILKIFSQKFLRFVLGLVGLNDAKGIDVAQRLWLSNLVSMRLLTDSRLTPNFKKLALKPTRDSKKFVGGNTRSQFGELSQSALQI